MRLCLAVAAWDLPEPLAAADNELLCRSEPRGVKLPRWCECVAASSEIAADETGLERQLHPMM